MSAADKTMQALREEQLLHLTKKQINMIGTERAHESAQAQRKARGVLEMHDSGVSVRPPFPRDLVCRAFLTISNQVHLFPLYPFYCHSSLTLYFEEDEKREW